MPWICNYQACLRVLFYLLRKSIPPDWDTTISHIRALLLMAVNRISICKQNFCIIHLCRYPISNYPYHALVLIAVNRISVCKQYFVWLNIVSIKYRINLISFSIEFTCATPSIIVSGKKDCIIFNCIIRNIIFKIILKSSIIFFAF